MTSLNVMRPYYLAKAKGERLVGLCAFWVALAYCAISVVYLVVSAARGWDALYLVFSAVWVVLAALYLWLWRNAARREAFWRELAD